MLKANNKKIMNKVIVANSFRKFKGLMFERKENFDYALVFEFVKEGITTSSLHMLFVFFPTDVVFLNKQKIVVDKFTMYPWKLYYAPKKPAKYAIELPEGKAKEINCGDKISW
jgi:uncharacterized protein